MASRSGESSHVPLTVVACCSGRYLFTGAVDGEDRTSTPWTVNLVDEVPGREVRWFRRWASRRPLPLPTESMRLLLVVLVSGPLVVRTVVSVWRSLVEMLRQKSGWRVGVSLSLGSSI